MTGVLAATCLWAVTVLVLAITGMGGRVEPLKDDPSLVDPVAAAKLTAVAPRLGVQGEYVEVGERPLMTQNRRPVPVGPVAGEGAAEQVDVALTSVLITPRLQMAILTDNQGGQSRRVRVGDMLAGTSWRLVSVAPRSATIEGPGGQRTLELRVFNGDGAVQPLPGQPVAGEEVPMPANAAPDPNAAGPQPVPVPAPTPAPAATQAENLTQEQQIEAIRRRIEARRAQMRAEAGKQADDKR